MTQSPDFLLYISHAPLCQVLMSSLGKEQRIGNRGKSKERLAYSFTCHIGAHASDSLGTILSPHVCVVRRVHLFPKEQTRQTHQETTIDRYSLQTKLQQDILYRLTNILSRDEYPNNILS